VDFFSNLIVPLVDTYFVTLMAIEQICGKNLVLKQKKFVKELHVCIKRLYQDKVINHLHSCLNDIIETAVERFEQMGFLEIRAYVKKSGNTTLFMNCPSENNAGINAIWN